MGPFQDSQSLRRTHFKLGDYTSPYNTTTMDQNKNIERGNRPHSIVHLDQNAKNDLRKSHFILGNFEPNYNTVFRTEFSNKNYPGDNNTSKAAKEIEKNLRSHNYVLGNDKPEYRSETQAKFEVPKFGGGRIENKISTHEIQKSNYIFGNNHDPWATTSQLSYYPKLMEAKKYTQNLARTNFVFGEDKGNFRSVNQETYIPHQLSKANESKELSQDLRSKNKI